MSSVDNVRKVAEFKAFIAVLEGGEFDTWELLADTLGVHPNTIQEWKQLPEAKRAIAKGLQNAVKQMETVGKKDWRMWREKIALLRREKEKEIEIPNKTLNIYQQYNIGGLTNDERQRRIAEVEARIADLEGNRSNNQSQ